MQPIPSSAITPSKALIVALCCAVPLAFLFAGWMVFDRNGDNDVVQRIALGLGVALVTGLVALRAFESCTVRLDDAGVEYVKFAAGRKFFLKRRLQWADVVQVSVDGNACVLKGSAVEVPIRLIVFSEPRIVLDYIKSRLPLDLVRATFGMPGS